jgi:hypothetical protein
MQKTISGITMPIAYIATNRNRLKVYNLQNLYLRGGQEFQIELFNPLQETVAAKIYLNGKSISNSMIVLKPGERAFLERFIDDNRKFKFDTYEVENSSEAQKAIEKNGLVRVEFFKEQAPALYTTYTYNQPYNPIYTTAGTFYCGTASTGIGLTGTGSSTTTNINNASTPTSGNNARLRIASLGGDSASLGGDSFVVGGGAASYSASLDSVETGRVESGDASSQSFGTHYGSFYSYPFTYVEYHLMPESHKPVEVNQLRNYCPGCGNRIRKSSWKFCPGCGATI